MKTKAERLRALLKDSRDIAAKAEAEERDLTGEERGVIEGKLAEAGALKKDVAVEKALAGFEGEIEALDTKAGSTIDGANKGARKSGSLGRVFTEAEAITEWTKAAAPAGQFPEKGRVQSPAIAFNGLKAFGYHEGTGRPRATLPAGSKALIIGDDDTSAGALIEDDFLGLVDPDPYARPLNLLDVVTRGTTGSDTVEYVRVDTVVNAAAPTPEATDAGVLISHDPVSGTVTDAAGGLKPESTITLEKLTAPVRQIAHWLPATKRALSDAAQIRTLIDNFLRYGLFEELEDQIINGDGTGENFTGILNITGVQSQIFSTDILETSRLAKTKVRVGGRATANAYLLHPNDAEVLDLTKDLQGRFYYGGPTMDGAQPLWRLPVVETEAIAAGTGIVGDFRRAVIWDREQAAVSISDSHADFFIRNLVAILAELRAAFGVFRPAAFCTFATA